MIICINGLGNIGTSLALLLNDYKSELGIKTIIGFKNIDYPWIEEDLNKLKDKGIEIILSKNQSLESIINSVDFVFDTTTNGMGLKNKAIYQKSESLKGAIAQGSEKRFGIPYMSGINASIKSKKFVQIVSCNTHGAAAILNLFAGENLQNQNKSDFVVVRRSEDIGNHTRLVGANVVARHLSDDIGTHHAIDVKDLYKTLDINCNITSSDITTPSQLMHATRFNISLNSPIDWNIIETRIETNPLISQTNKFDSNLIFELGRRYGKYGRIYNHVILVMNNLLITEKSVKGWAFVPQEGNTLFSTIEAFTAMINLNNKKTILNQIKKDLMISNW